MLVKCQQAQYQLAMHRKQEKEMESRKSQVIESLESEKIDLLNQIESMKEFNAGLVTEAADILL